MAALPAVLVLPNHRAPLLVMAALPAVLLLPNHIVAPFAAMIVALPALLVL